MSRESLLEGLLERPVTIPKPAPSSEALAELARTVDRAALRRLHRSLVIREVDAGSRNGCELEIHALGNAIYDLERFGIRFAASLEHADVLVVTGPVTCNMVAALQRAWECTPDPKWVVAVGDCAAGCGVFAGSYALVSGTGAVAELVPVHLHIKGRPPSPMARLQGLLALLESSRAPAQARGGTSRRATTPSRRASGAG